MRRRAYQALAYTGSMQKLQYHEAILSDAVQVISSIDRELISGRRQKMKGDVVERNHYKLV